MNEQEDPQRIQRIGNYGPMTALLIMRLRKLPEKSVVTDEMLASWVGESCAVGGKGYSWLLSAIRALEHEQIVWRRVNGEVCILRLTPEQIIEEVGQRRRHIAGHSRRSCRMLTAVDFEALPVPQRTAAAMELAVNAMLMRTTGAAVRKRLMCAAEKDSSLPGLNVVLAATIANLNGGGGQHGP